MYIKKRIKYFVFYILIILLIVYLSFPFLWTFISSLKTEKDLYSKVVSVNISNLNFDRYVKILTGHATSQAAMGTGGEVVGSESLRSFKSGYLNSLIIALGVTVIGLFIGSLSAYAFVRFKSKLINALHISVIATMFLPGIVLTVPFFILIRSIGLMDTKLGLIIIYISFVLPQVVWLMGGFFETIPIEIEEAARIDGCSRLRIIFKIILPLSTSAIATSGLIAFVIAWQEFLFALILTSSPSSKTLPVAMAEFFSRQGMDLGMTNTGAILATIPVVILTLIGQKYIIKGLSVGSVKE